MEEILEERASTMNYSQMLTAALAWAGPVFGAAITPRQATRDSCPGYTATNVVNTATSLTADLSLAGIACNVYGNDVQDLKLLVNYDSGNCSIFVFGKYILI
jgi:alpha-glucosidase